MTQSAIYGAACERALAGHDDGAHELFEQLAASADAAEQARAHNGLGVLAAVGGDERRGLELFERALQLDPACRAAQQNRLILRGDSCGSRSERRTRIAILSFLFNWPSTGGGIVHTVELAQFLERAGYEVRLLHPRFEPWGIGRVDNTCPVPTEVLPFREGEWSIAGIQQRFRSAVDAFGPDHVLITDCWNFKPHLARAVEGYSYFLRMQALECVCPLNNLRLQPTQGTVRQCRGSQLARPQTCIDCLQQHGPHSGSLHQAERALSEVGTAAYDAALHQSLERAAAVLVLNRSAAALWEPYAADVRVVTWGMDPARFPWPSPAESGVPGCEGLTTLLFAGLPQEPIKGFDVLSAACAQLWSTRQDFRLIVTADLEPPHAEYLVPVGWKSQSELPQLYRATDITVVPTIAQEGLSRTAVEAMASGRPVLGSRIGGMPDVVTDGATGLLGEPGNVDDWARQIAWLLDHPDARRRMGQIGRERFERAFTWQQVVEEQYGPLLGAPTRSGVRRSSHGA